jgi:hypothetical protein
MRLSYSLSPVLGGERWGEGPFVRTAQFVRIPTAKKCVVGESCVATKPQAMFRQLVKNFGWEWFTPGTWYSKGLYETDKG